MRDRIQRFMTRGITVRPSVALIVGGSIVALFLADCALLRSNDRLRTALRSRTTSMAPRVGTAVPGLQGLALDGEPIAVTYTGESRQTVLLVFSTECPFCDANWPYWESMARQVDADRFRLVYVNISNSMSEDYMRTHYFHPSADVLAGVDPQSAVDYSLRPTPMVLLVDSSATIRNVWVGVTRDSSARAMESALGVSFGGIMPAYRDGG